MEYQCDISTIDLYYFGPMNRTELANIVIGCDALICIVWLINICWMGRAINNEQHEIDEDFVHIVDFAVRIKNLPEKPAYDNLF